MKIFKCNQCNSEEVYLQPSGDRTALYCCTCGKWITWLSKEDQQEAERQIEERRNKAVVEQQIAVELLYKQEVIKLAVSCASLEEFLDRVYYLQVYIK